jgi:hypothetical protein
MWTDPAVAAMDQAIEALRRQRFLERLAAEFAELRANPEAWCEELAERTAWDAAIGDDLEEA